MASAPTPFKHPDVAAKFAAYPPRARTVLLALRELIFKTAAITEGVGELEESLRWGEPAYLTAPKVGSTVRIDWKAANPEYVAMYFHCQTGLVDSFRSMFPNDFKFEGNRALVFEVGRRIPHDSLAICIAASLTYHVRKRATKRRDA